MTTPTQVHRPWRATVRTIFQFAIALATLLPFIAAGIYTDPEQTPAVVGQLLVVAGVITRVMALPQVEAFLAKFFPWLAADPDAPARDEFGQVDVVRVACFVALVLFLVFLVILLIL